MSADNYLEIWRCSDRKYRGYMKCASMEYPNKQPKWHPQFTADTIEKAIDKAQSTYTEYGYCFKGLEVNDE